MNDLAPKTPGSIYITLRLDVLSGVLKEIAEQDHARRDGVSVREVRLLLIVREHPGLTMGRLVQLSFMEKTMASKAITRLTELGLIERQIGAADARQVQLVLTRKGRGAADRAHAYVLEATDGLMQVLSPSERASFDAALTRMTEHVLALRERSVSLVPPQAAARAPRKKSAGRPSP